MGRSEAEGKAGVCCACGYRGRNDDRCPAREDRIHCEHWCDGADEDFASPSVRMPDAERWIPVSERLPEENLRVIVHVYSWGNFPSYVDRDFRQDGKWAENYGMAREVTHWMPLPEPPVMEHGSTGSKTASPSAEGER